MDALNIIVLAGGGASAVLAIITLIVKLVKGCKKIVNFIHTMEQKVDTLVEHDNAQYLSILRLTIINETMPMSERLIAGKKYVERGGNGEVKKIYESLKCQCNNIHHHN